VLIASDREPHGDPISQRRHVRDHADHPVPPGRQVLQGGGDDVERGLIKGAEPFIKKIELRRAAPWAARVDSWADIARASARLAWNVSPPDSVFTGRWSSASATRTSSAEATS
jgi:hypothetical protein